MLEKQFIRFGATTESVDAASVCGVGVPVAAGAQFFMPKGTLQGDYQLAAVDASGEEYLALNVGTITSPADSSSDYKLVTLGAISAPAIIAGECFRLVQLLIEEHTYSSELPDIEAEIENMHAGNISQLMGSQDQLPAGTYAINLTNMSLTATITHLGSQSTSSMVSGSILITDEDDSTLARYDFTEGAIGTQRLLLFTLQEASQVFVCLTLKRIEGVPAGAAGYRHDITFESSEAIAGRYTTITQGLISNLLRYQSETNGLSLLEYWCDEDEYGLPFVSAHPAGSDAFHIKQWLPFLVRNPQYKTKEETYEKLSGERVLLMATIAKEYELETEYLPEAWHDMIITALECDHVSVNGVEMFKSSDYSVDWEKYTDTDCGTRLTRATSKLQTNFNSRNSN